MGDNYDVTSHNQQGGITAGQVNFGKPQRKLDANLKSQLDKGLAAHAHKEVQITINLSCEDGPEFARQIKAYLETKGFKVRDVKTALLPVRPNRFDIDVGHPVIEAIIS